MQFINAVAFTPSLSDDVQVEIMKVMDQSSFVAAVGAEGKIFQFSLSKIFYPTWFCGFSQYKLLLKKTNLRVKLAANFAI